MNLRENIQTERNSRTDRLTEARCPVGRVPGVWLTCYPIFQDALRCGETTFRALPDYAQSVVLRRTTMDVAKRVTESKKFDGLRVSFVELHTQTVSDAVEHSLRTHDSKASILFADSARSPQALAEQVSLISYPLIARPPCLLHPGRHVFSDGWTQFFAYRSRGDITIPLLAIDWLDFHDRLDLNHNHAG